jgi:hypothetical protein
MSPYCATSPEFGAVGAQAVEDVVDGVDHAV